MDLESTSDKPKSTWLDALYVLFSLLTAFCFCEFLFFGGTGISIPLLTILVYTLSLSYLKKNNQKICCSNGAVVTFVFILLLLACFIFYDNYFLRFFNLSFLFLLIPLNISYFAGTNEYLFFSAGSLFDIIKAFLVFPFSNLDKSVSVLATRNSKKANSALKIIVGIIIASPLFLIILSLLISSDIAFQHVVSSIFSFVRIKFSSYILKIFLSVILTFPIFSFIYSVIHKNRNYKMKKYGISKKIRIIDRLFINASLWVISMIYVLYMVTQFGYFFNAFQNILPEKFTYAEYARKGFFELVAVSFINMIVIIFVIALSKRKKDQLDKQSKISITVLSLLTLMLIITAMSKMAMYIQNFGFTMLRVYASWFMVVLTAIFLFFIIKMLNFNFKFLKTSAVTVMVLYLALNIVNIDYFIPKYNIEKYMANKSKGIDIAAFYQLSDSMVPQAVKLLDDPQYKDQITILLKQRNNKIKHDCWENFSFSQLHAMNAMAEISSLK